MWDDRNQNPNGRTVFNDRSGEIWRKNGEIHRLDGPAFSIVTKYGINQEWYKDGKHHNENGPAIIDHNIGTTAWMIEGKYHRSDGPAVITKTGKYYWRINGVEYKSIQEWGQALISNGYKTTSEVTMLILKWSK